MLVVTGLSAYHYKFCDDLQYRIYDAIRYDAILGSCSCSVLYLLRTHQPPESRIS